MSNTSKADRKALEAVLAYLDEGEAELAALRLREFLAAHPDGRRIT